MIRPLLISLVLFMVSPSLAAAASFDCERATTETEIAICNDPELSAYENLLRQYPEYETYLMALFEAGTPIAEAAEMVRAYKERQSGFISISEFFHNTMPERYLNNYDWLTDRIEERLPINGPPTYNWFADGVDRFFQLPIFVLLDIYKYEVVKQREYIESLIIMHPEQFKAYWETEIDTAAAAKWFQASYHNQRFSDGQIDLDISAKIRTMLTFTQTLALFWLFTLCWSLIVATSHVREPSKDTLKRVILIQLLGSTAYGILKGISDPKDFVFIIAPLVWVPIVLAAAWVVVKALNVARPSETGVWQANSVASRSHVHQQCDLRILT